MLERDYQSKIINRLSNLFPGALILKNDPTYIQGMPDLVIFYGNQWAMLEVKSSIDSLEQPNQRYYVDHLNTMSFAAFIYPENEESVIDALQSTFGTPRQTRLFEPEQL